MVLTQCHTGLDRKKQCIDTRHSWVKDSTSIRVHNHLGTNVTGSLTACCTVYLKTVEVIEA